MKGTILYGPRDIRFEERDEPQIIEPTDAILRLAATCVCGSDLWPYRGIDAPTQPTPMGHECCGVVEEVGPAVQSVKPGQLAQTNRDQPSAISNAATSFSLNPRERSPGSKRSSHPSRPGRFLVPL